MGGEDVNWSQRAAATRPVGFFASDMLLIWREAVGPLASTVLATPVGKLRLCARGEALVSVDWVEPEGVEGHLTPVLEQAAAALLRYFQAAHAPMELPLHPAGTEYQRRIWQQLAAIAPGQVASYGCVARELGSGARAVAAACRANPYPLIIPCHRVVATYGLGGYCGANDGPWLEIKKWLLAHEQSGMTEALDAKALIRRFSARGVSSFNNPLDKGRFQTSKAFR